MATYYPPHQLDLKMKTKLDQIKEALETGGTVFYQYADLHKNKNTADGDYKAKRNLVYAKRLEDALQSLKEIEDMLESELLLELLESSYDVINEKLHDSERHIFIEEYTAIATSLELSIKTIKGE